MGKQLLKAQVWVLKFFIFKIPLWWYFREKNSKMILKKLQPTSKGSCEKSFYKAITVDSSLKFWNRFVRNFMKWFTTTKMRPSWDWKIWRSPSETPPERINQISSTQKYWLSIAWLQTGSSIWNQLARHKAWQDLGEELQRRKYFWLSEIIRSYFWWTYKAWISSCLDANYLFGITYFVKTIESLWFFQIILCNKKTVLWNKALLSYFTVCILDYRNCKINRKRTNF